MLLQHFPIQIIGTSDTFLPMTTDNANMGISDIRGAVFKPGCGYRKQTFCKLLSNLMHKKFNLHKVNFQVVSHQA